MNNILRVFSVILYNIVKKEHPTNLLLNDYQPYRKKTHQACYSIRKQLGREIIGFKVRFFKGFGFL